MASRSAEAANGREALLAELTSRVHVNTRGAAFGLVTPALAAVDVFIAILLIGVDSVPASCVWLLLSALSHFCFNKVHRLDPSGADADKPFDGRTKAAFATLFLARTGLVVSLLVQPAVLEHFVAVSIILSITAFAVSAALPRPLAYLAWALPVAAALSGALMHKDKPEAVLAGFLVAALIGVVVAHVREQHRMTESMLALLQHRDQITMALRAERDVATESSASKTRFFAAASHDLRQPLHALSINATTLQLVAGKQTDPVIRDLSDSINRALQRSNGLLDSLLDLSRLDSNAVDLNMESVNAIALLTAVADQFQPSADERGLSLTVESASSRTEGIYITTDVGLMLRVLGNLVSNAIKFTSQGGVRLSALIDEDSAHPDTVILKVSDTGRGIAPNELKRVFDEFYQVGNPQKDTDGGLGLGLSIVRRATDLMGVRVEMHSVVGKGTVASLAVPRSVVASSSRMVDAVPVSPSPSNTNDLIRALLVEDEKEICDSLNGFMPYLGYEIQSASNTAEALSIVERGFKPTVLIIDQLLRHETGLLVTHRLWRVLGRVPAVMVTGDTEPATMELALASGIRVVHKPVDGMRLLQILRDVQGAASVSSTEVPPATA